MQFITGAYQPILVLSGVVCLVGLIAWARDARAGDPMVDHARRITHLRRDGARLRTREAWHVAGSVPAVRAAPSLAPRIAGGLHHALRYAARGATWAVATAVDRVGSGADVARPRVARATAGAAAALLAIASAVQAEGLPAARVAFARVLAAVARARAALSSALAQPAPGATTWAEPDRQVGAPEQVPGWLPGVRRSDASLLPFAPLSGIPSLVTTPQDLEPRLDRERSRLA